MRMRLSIVCLALALGSAAFARQSGRLPITAPPGMSVARGGVIQGYVFWPTNAAQYNHAAPCSPLKVRVVPRSGGGTFHGEDDDLTHVGVIGGYEVCAYRIQGVPEGQDMHMLFLPNPPGFTPSLTFDMARVDRQFPKYYINIPGGACNTMVATTPTVSELTTAGWWPCGDNAYDVNFGVYPSNIPTTRVNGPMRVALGTPVQSGTPNGTLLAPRSQQTLLGGGGTQSLPPQGNSNVTVGGGAARKLALPPNLKVFMVGEAKNPAALNSVRNGRQLMQNGGGTLGPEQTMSATGGGNNVAGAANATPGAVAIRPMASGPAAMQPSTGGGSRGVLSTNNTRTVCMNSGIAAVNGARFTQFTPGTHYVITGCGFGSTPGKVYLSGPFPAHNGKIEIGPYWQYGTTRSWTGHWSDQVIDAQLDEALSGELDQYNVVLVVETSTGQQIQMNNISFKAQRAEFMLGSIPMSALSAGTGFGTANSPCTSSWVTGNCTVDMLREVGATGLPNSPDTYTIKLKSGFVLSRATLLVMDQTKVTSWTTPQISNANQIVVNWQWTTYESLSYSLYGLQIYVIGPLGVTDAWGGQ